MLFYKHNAFLAAREIFIEEFLQAPTGNWEFNMRIKQSAILLTAAMVFSLAACGGGGTAEESSADAASTAETADAASTESGDKKVYTIAKSFANLDENNKRSMEMFEDSANQYMAEHPEIEIKIITTDAQSSQDKQISDVETLIAQSPDILIISEVDTIGAIPAFQAAKAAGIITMGERGTEDESVDIFFQGMDENSIMEMKKRFIEDYLEKNPDAVLNFGLIYGLASQTEQLKRNDDVIALAEEKPDRVKVLDKQYADWSTDKATNITEDWLMRYPEMNAISTASDDMTLGACNALAAQGKTGFITMGVDGTKIGREQIKLGNQTMTVLANQKLIEGIRFDVCIGAIEGTFKDSYATAGVDGLVVLTKDNVDEYMDVE